MLHHGSKIIIDLWLCNAWEQAEFLPALLPSKTKTDLARESVSGPVTTDAYENSTKHTGINKKNYVESDLILFVHEFLVRYYVIA